MSDILEWVKAQKICDLPLVDESIKGLLLDPTNDNATMLVREVMRAVTMTYDYKGMSQPLRKLRIWHYEGVQYRRNAAKFYEEGKSKSKPEKAVEHAAWQHTQAEFHKTQVDLLNSFFAPEDTAATDLANEMLERLKCPR